MAAIPSNSTQLDERYLSLIRSFPLRPIRDDEHLDQAIDKLNELLDLTERNEAEEDYLAVLGTLIGDYEREHVRLPAVRGTDALRHLMEENGLTQADLVPFFGAPSTVSMVLSGKRRLALSHIAKLSQHFGLPADVFIDDQSSS